MNRLVFTLAFTAILASAAGCSRQSEAPQAVAPSAAEPAAGTSVAAAAAAEPAITKDSPIWFEPEALSSCQTAQVVVVHWNAGSFPGVLTAKVTVPGAPGKDEGVFAVAGAVGQKETGPWARAGGEFVLRDAATNAELHRARIPSLPCANSPAQ